MARNDDTESRPSRTEDHSSHQLTTQPLISEDRKIHQKRLSKAANAVLFLTTISPTGFFSRKHLTDQIQKLCRHDEMTIFERHGAHPSVERLSESERNSLRRLCKKQLEFSQSHKAQIYDGDLIILAVSDPIIYETLLSLLEIETNGPHVQESSFESFATSGIVYELWSEFIGYRLSNDCDEKSMQARCDALKRTLRGTHAIMAREFLLHAVKLELEGQELEFLLQIWHHFLQISNWSKFDLGRLERYVNNIISSGKSLGDFMSPNHLSRLGSGLARDIDHTQNIFNVFLAVPKIVVAKNLADLSVEICYELVRGWSLDDASSYAIHYEQNVALKSPSGSLANTVLSDDNWMALYHIADYALSNYRRGGGIHARECVPWSMQRYLLTLARTSLAFLKIRTSKTSYENRKNEALAVFYISQSFDIDRYCKKIIMENEDSSMIALLSSHSRFLNRTQILNGLYELTFIPQFRNVPYLRRYRINGKYFVTSDGLPEPSAVLLGHHGRKFPKKFSVDTLLLDGHSFVCLRVHGRTKGFYALGHYPILVGFKSSRGGARRAPLYVGVVRFEDNWYFTCVEEGALRVTYTDEVGDVKNMHDFFVLALRHNPSDIAPPYPRSRTGAMNPTGPVFWLKLWPEKDPEYYEDLRLTDDRYLESFLNRVRAYGYGGKEENILLSGFAYFY
ncbi:hypothetical protein SCHPADRAFT_946058 [Schizopora paradoxa]|uniref:Uncharacterized protein n=1 Tax=Schizopora paradoxa TaxID=27342 RepID=A0A0H2RAI1_9AGAM|nr:hypothetical protein SCHPADRAFT_946058 [Schizopora paradoxa]